MKLPVTLLVLLSVLVTHPSFAQTLPENIGEFKKYLREDLPIYSLSKNAAKEANALCKTVENYLGKGAETLRPKILIVVYESESVTNGALKRLFTYWWDDFQKRTNTEPAIAEAFQKVDKIGLNHLGLTHEEYFRFIPKAVTTKIFHDHVKGSYSIPPEFTHVLLVPSEKKLSELGDSVQRTAYEKSKPGPVFKMIASPFMATIRRNLKNDFKLPQESLLLAFYCQQAFSQDEVRIDAAVEKFVKKRRLEREAEEKLLRQRIELLKKGEAP